MSGSLYSTNTCTNIIMINIHSVEYYFQWQLGQFSDSLEAGPHVVCFLAEARDIPSIQNIRPAHGTSGLLFSGCCGSFPSDEAADALGYHSALFSSAATDQCSCNCASPVCLHGVRRDSFCRLLLFCRNVSSIYMDIILPRRK